MSDSPTQHALRSLDPLPAALGADADVAVGPPVPSATRIQAILTTFIVAIVLGGSAMAVLLTSRVFDRLTPWAAADLEWKVRFGAKDIAQATLFGSMLEDQDLVRESLQPFKDQADFDYIVVADATGKPRVVHGRHPDDIASLFAGPPETVERTLAHFTAWAPIKIEGRTVGRVAVAVSTERLQDGERLRQNILIVAGVGCALALSFSFFFVYYYIGPLIRLTGKTLAKLRELNMTLESKVTARTLELATSNQQLEQSLEALRNVQRKLIDTSRAAGMAEVASNVLHNVGNVLNSVNVSVAVTLANLRTCPTGGLQQAATMLRQHESDLPTFFANDPKAKLLVEYLHKLAEASLLNKEAMGRELSKLRDHVDHIKVIISTQQSLARLSGMVERLSLRDLVEETFSLSESAFKKHGIEFQREFQELDIVESDRHRLFQILVNLFNNARDALKDHPGPRRVRVSVRQLPEDRFVIELQDTGCGIAPENMAKIFAHGFSTKPEGHGFGLHGSACAAMEIGGTLTAASDGPGRGATFRLELPRRQQSEKRAA